jgi:signal transduction histidine kinase/ligand-binding sensor domain-containing protein
LVLYDGYTSATFEHDVADPSSLSDNAIRVLYEDRQGRLWIGTNTGGLNALDRATWRFRSFRHDSKSKDSISNDSVYAIAEDSGGRLWVGTQSGLDRFDPATGVFEHVQGLSDSYVDALFAAPDGTLFIGTVGGGLDRLDPATGSITVYRHDPKDEGTLRSDGIFALAGDPSGALYVASSIGVDRFDPSSGRAAGVPFAGVGKGEREHLVTSLARSDDGTLWAGTFESGLFAFLRGGDAFAPAAAGVAPRVTCLLADRAGRVWAGTWGGGLVRVAHGSGRFGSVNMGAPGGALVETTAVLEDRSGNLWSGESPSLAKRDPSGRTTRWPALGGAVALSEGPLGRLFVGTPFDCVELDPQAGAVRWRANPNRPRDAPVGPGWIWSVLEDREGQVWIGTGGGGLFRRRADGAYDRFRHDPADARSLSDDYVVALLESRDGALWVGTRSGGLNVLLRGGTAFTRFEPVAADPRSLSHHSVLTLLEDARGTLWAGTGGGGLDRVDRDPAGKVAFTRFTEQDGLIDDNIVSLAEDDDGSLWIGTRRGLSRFDPGSGRFASFGAEDGLPSVEFANGAASRGRHALYFGTHRGIVSVARGAPFPPALPSPAVVTSVRTLSGAVLGARPPWGDGRIEIPYGESLTFEMAVLDYGDRRRHRYAYRLDGLSSSWVDLGTRREVTLTHLDPGAYVLHVKGRNDQGMWSEAPVALRIRVIPPFWMTAWFRALCAAAVVAAAFMVHRVRTATLTRRNRQLMVLQEQRERALDEVGASQQALGQAYARLRGLTRRLEAAKEDERKRIARELHDEMGQILTTAKLNLQLVSGTAEPAERERRIGDSIGLIDRLIGHVRALSLALRPPLLDELGLAAALRGYVEAQARHSGLTITLAASPGPAELPADVEIAAFRVVQESVTNVLRHAEAKHVTVELRYDPRWILLLVTDDGHGFDVAAVERASDGRHLGLLGMKERVESMGGTIQIASTPAGSTVEVRLPWER